MQESKVFPRTAIAAAMAYGLFLVCTASILWGDYTIMLSYGESMQNAQADYFAREGAFAFTFLIVAIVAYFKPRARAWRSPLVALALACVGAAILHLQTTMQSGSFASNTAMGTCFGVGCALYFCTLQEVVAEHALYNAGVIVFSAAAISAVCYFAVSWLFSGTVIAAFPTVAIIAVTVMLMVLSRKQERNHPMFQTVPRNNPSKFALSFREWWRSLLCVSFSGFIIGMIRTSTILQKNYLELVNQAGMLGLLLAAIVLLLAWRQIYARSLLKKLHVFLFPLIATSFLMMPFFSYSRQWMFVAFANIVFSITSSLMVVSSVRAARSYALHPVAVYGAFATCMYGLQVLGSAMATLIGSLDSSNVPWLFVVALVAIYLLSILMALGRGRGSGSQASAGAESPAVNAPTRRPRSMEQRCAGVAQHYGLSAREAEIMGYLARGRDVAFIAEELTISKNTVKTHVRNVFTKLDVHSRQDVIDIVERFEA